LAGYYLFMSTKPPSGFITTGGVLELVTLSVVLDPESGLNQRDPLRSIEQAKGQYKEWLTFHNNLVNKYVLQHLFGVILIIHL